MLLERESVEPDLRGLAGGVHLGPEQLQRRAVGTGVPDRAVERERHPRVRGGIAPGQFPQHLDTGKVAMVQVGSQPCLYGARPLRERRAPVEADLDQQRLGEVPDGVGDAWVNRRSHRDGGGQREPAAGGHHRASVSAYAVSSATVGVTPALVARAFSAAHASGSSRAVC